MPLPAIAAAAGASGGLRDVTGAITDITGLFSDQKRSGNQTTTTTIDQVGMQYMLEQLLGSSQGLAAVLNEGKGAGVYNSATQGLLANDLVARMLGEVAARSPTVTTKENSKVDAPLDGIGGAVGDVLDTGGDILTAAYGGKKVLGIADKVLTGGLAGKAVKKVKKKLKKLF